MLTAKRALRPQDEATLLQSEIEQSVKSRPFPDEQAVLHSALRAPFESHPDLKRR
jgi:hypothetical protein